MTKVSVVILNYKGEEDTVKCISSIYESNLSKIDLDVIVVDNDSPKDSADLIKRFVEEKKLSNFTLIEQDKNLGFAGGNNIGIKLALEKNAEYVVVLNNDTIVDKNMIQELVDVVQRDKKIGIVVPKIYFEKGYEFHKDRYKKEDKGKVIWYAGGIIDWRNVLGSHRGVDEVDRGQYDEITETDYASGCCFLIPSNVLKTVGMFSEDYFLYYEDSDLSMRVKDKGYKILYNPKAVVWHKNASSSGGSGSNLQDYYITRNRLLFGMKYAPLRSKISLLREAFRLMISGRENQKRGVKDFYLRRFNKAYCLS